MTDKILILTVDYCVIMGCLRRFHHSKVPSLNPLPLVTLIQCSSLLGYYSQYGLKYCLLRFVSDGQKNSKLLTK